MKIFMALNFVAGLLHYLFLVVASKQLGAQDFSDLSAWLAYLSFAFVGSSVLQYLSCFTPLPRSSLRRVVGVGVVLTLIAVGMTMVLPLDHVALGLCAGVLACALGLFLGQAQARLQLLGMGLANVTLASTKLLLCWGLPLNVAEKFFWALPLAYAPAILLLAVRLMRYGEEPPLSRPAAGALLATVVLGTASTLFPQFELILMRQSLNADAFQEFARLSLFYKAIFFAFLIFSHWLLPHQLRNPKRASQALGDARLYLAVLTLGILAAALGPGGARLILGWEVPPRPLALFLSCWNMGLLTWIFLVLQDLIARRQNKRASQVLAAVFLTVPIQLAAHLPVEFYFGLALLLNSIILRWSLTSLVEASPKSSSPANAA